MNSNKRAISECMCCGTEVLCNIYTMTHGNLMGEYIALCDYCYGSEAGKVTLYPTGNHDATTVLRALGAMFNLLEKRLREVPDELK